MNTDKKDIDLFIDAFSAVVSCNKNSIDVKSIDFPDFVTVDDFGQVNFYNEAKIGIYELSKKLHSSFEKIDRTLEIKEYTKSLRQAIAEIYTENIENLEYLEYLDYQRLLVQLKSKINSKIEKLKIEITHHFSYMSVGFELDEPFALGPVKFSRKDSWIRESSFAEVQKSGYSQEQIRSFLLEPNDENFQKLDFSLQAISTKFENSRTIASTKIANREFHISKKIAKITTKSALDAISLLLGNQKFFTQNILTEDVSMKGYITSVSSQKDLVYFSGSDAGKIIPIASGKQARNYMKENLNLINSFSYIIDNFSMDKKGKYPNLCHRWISALDWFAEGCREENDSIALAKMSLSLDVLAASGGSRGTLDVISNLLGISKAEIVNKNKNLTLEELFSSLYREGRSKIVHGEVADRFQTFEDLKNHIFYLVKAVLINAALALSAYEGEDKKDAFKTMKPA